MNCEYRNNNSHPVCKLGMYNGMPSVGICRRCIDFGQNNEEYANLVKNNTSGIGDIVHKIANPIAKTIDGVFGTNIQKCGGCKNRREKLNKMFPISIE